MGGMTSTSVKAEIGGSALHIDISQPDLVEELTKEARRKKKSLSSLVEKILADYLEELEDYQAVKAAIKRDKGKPSITLEELKKKHGLES